MSKFEKLVNRFLSKPKDFTYEELRKLLSGFGYEEAKIGKTTGSRVALIDRKTKHIIRLHKPHPDTVLKHYQLNDVEEVLKKIGVLK